jgi:hypothetical protein
MNSSFFDRRTPTLDTCQPGVRHIQELIRHSTPVRLQLISGTELEGTLRWQDLQYLALCSGQDLPLTLINRDAIALIRALV